MQLTGKEVYKVIHDFRDIQQNRFYDLPLSVILTLQKNYTSVNAIYTIIRQTEQIIISRHNYENYDEEIEALMSEVFDVDAQFFNIDDIDSTTIPVSIAQTVMLFAKEV